MALALLGLLTAATATAFWPKYGLCLGEERAGAIACEIRRNLHFSAHFTWAVNVHTLDAVRPKVSEADIPALVSLLGDSRPAVRFAAGDLLSGFGEPGLAALREASRSSDATISLLAEDALRTLEIRRMSP